MKQFNIKFRFIPKNQLDSIVFLLQALDPKIDPKVLSQRLDQMKDADYQCVGIYDSDQLIGICGLWSLCKYYVGRHLEVDNVFIRPEYRKQGIGRSLMQWVESYAKEQNFCAIELNCYKDNQAGQEFWQNAGYTALGIHYQKLFE